MAVTAVQPAQQQSNTTTATQQAPANNTNTNTPVTQQAPAEMPGKKHCSCMHRQQGMQRRSGFVICLKDIAVVLAFIVIILFLIRIIRG